MIPTLPVDAVLPELHAALVSSRSAVLVAPPGAGKTTRIPLALIREEWMKGKRLIMLEPRRLAARRAAEFMAALLAERVGESVGYRIRGEHRVGSATRIEVVTEGILTRMVHDQPDLPGVGAVLFDEFHERSIHADLGLAFALDLQEHLRPDLRILAMSATLDAASVAALMGAARVVRSEGTLFPVETRYSRSSIDGPIEKAVSATTMRALRETSGDILVFLPGQREIRRTAEMLNSETLGPDVHLHLLFGDADPRQQRDALDPATRGDRKIILSTSIAETSLTIDGVRVVIDSGLSRLPQFDPRRGMGGLVTVPVSLASADQRRGRAGRQGPGVCYRLWTEVQEASLPRTTMPEILTTDLTPLALDLALWGSPHGEHLRFLDAPPPGHLAQARSVLSALGALDARGNVTSHGKAIANLGLHPRIAHMILRGQALGRGAQACRLAAIMAERIIVRSQDGRDVDITTRWDAIQNGRGIERALIDRVNAEEQRLRRLLSIKPATREPGDIGVLVALAYPDRVARRKPSGEGFLLSNGTAGTLPPRSGLSHDEFLAVAEVDGVGTTVRILLAAPLERRALEAAFQEQLERTDEAIWDEATGAAVRRRRLMLGALALEETITPASGGFARTALVSAVRAHGLSVLPWSDAAESLVRRSEWLRAHRLVAEDWPAMDETTLKETLEEWLGPALEGVTRLSQLRTLDLEKLLHRRLSVAQVRELERLAPERIAVPTGSMIRIEYNPQNAPVLAVKLQEMFGQTTTPSVGTIPLTIHLLSPAGRPLAVTQDLPSFWKNGYPDVRKEMRGRYPKHPWPEDPLNALPTRKVGGKRRR